MNVRGTTSQSVQEYYESHGGPTAYLGTAIPGFPNLFTLAGIPLYVPPMCTSLTCGRSKHGHWTYFRNLYGRVPGQLASSLRTHSGSPSFCVQVNYIIQLIRLVLSGPVLSLEVTAGATEEYNKKIQAKLSYTVWSQCVSWYRVGGYGRNCNIFPGTGLPHVLPAR